MMDLIWTCAYSAIISPTECVRPDFTDTTAIKQGVHPILHTLSSKEPFVPNDIYLHNGASFAIITGPNMVRLWFSIKCIS